MAKKALFWFRQDLRLKDNIALIHAVENGYDILPIFILDDDNAGEWKRGGASRWWLHQSLLSLNKSLNGNLIFHAGKADEILPELVEKTGAQAVFWNRCYEPWRIARDKNIKQILKDQGITCETFKDALLWEPWEIAKDDGTPYKVFTPFYRKGCLNSAPPASAKPTPKISFAAFDARGNIDDLKLMPVITWYDGMAKTWTPGEGGARDRLDTFLDSGLKGYKEDRNRPDLENVSRLSPHLHFGEISPREVWHKARTIGIAEGLEKDTDHFCSELGWREFSYSLLYHQPQLPREPLQEKFKAFPWSAPDPEFLEAWQKGRTGIPIVDAGMRQLWTTGWMHNRVRMIVASVLIKNMLIHWHHGEEWFWDTLIDADLANNAASWQWVAGCGADAAPYFRIFNPITQGQKFDPLQTYIKEWVPEFGTPDYPEQIVDLKASRERALEAFQSLKKAA